MRSKLYLLLLSSVLLAGSVARSSAAEPPLKIAWAKDMLTVSGGALGEAVIRVWYLEAYCRPDSQTTDWVTHTVIGHSTELVSSNRSGTRITLRCLLKDGVVVEHRITSKKDEVDFRVKAYNPTRQESEAHWAQPCVRVGEFTGLGDPKNPRTYDYLRKSFLFLEGKQEWMPTRDWATTARYVPGQVWAGPRVPRSDVNPRPLSAHTPSEGLIGCVSRDGSTLMATAWHPYQELFQGVATCLHSDFRIGGLAPGETKRIRGKLYVLPNDASRLLQRYHRDFPSARSPH